MMIRTIEIFQLSACAALQQDEHQRRRGLVVGAISSPVIGRLGGPLPESADIRGQGQSVSKRI